MRKHATFSMGLLLAILACGTAPADEPLRTLEEIADESPRHDVTGTVVDAEGNAVRKAEVFLYYQYGSRGLRNRLLGRTRTDRKGRFDFKQAIAWEPDTSLKNEVRPMCAVIANHPDVGMNFVPLFEGDPTEDVTVVLRAGTECKLVVKDVEGKRLEGIHVYLSGMHLSDEDAGDLPRAHRYLRFNEDIGLSSGRTDKTGRVYLMAQEAGAPFYAELAGHVRAYQRGTPDGKIMVMQQSAHISGQVTLEDGAPVPGAAVWYTYSGESMIYGDATVTDEEGRYVLENVPASGFFYSFTDPRRQEGVEGTSGVFVEDLRPGSPYVAKELVFQLKPGEDVTKDVTLARGVTYSATVIDATTKQPVPNLNIKMLITAGHRFLDDRALKTDANGVFRVTVAPGSDIRFEPVRASDASYLIDEDAQNKLNRQWWRGVIQEDMIDNDLAVSLWQVQPLKGRVVDAAGQPVNGATVHISHDVPSAKTDADGAFSFQVAPTDRDFDLLAVSENDDAMGVARLEAGATEATITLEPSVTYKLEITDTAGLPASNLSLCLDLQINDATIFDVRREATTDENGKCVAEQLCPGATYLAWWNSDNEQNRDYNSDRATVDLAEVAPGEPIRFEVKRYLDALMGRVVDHNGKPVQDAKIQSVSRGMLQGGRVGPIVTDENGEFEIPRVAHGTVSLKITAEGFKISTFEAASDSVDFEAALRPASEPTIHAVTVKDTQGSPLANLPVQAVVNWWGGDEPEIERRTRRTDADGRAEFRIEPAAPDQHGRATLGCDIAGYALTYVQADTREDIDLEFVLQPETPCWEGGVTNRDGQPLADATVKVGWMRPHNQEHFDRMASFHDNMEFVFKTDAEGRFELTRFSTQDTVAVSVSKDGYANGSIHFSPTYEVPHSVALPPGATVTGVVVDKDTGKPLGPGDIRLQDRRTHHGGRAEVADDGTFEISDLHPGNYQIMFGSKEQKEYVCPEWPTVQVDEGGRAEVVVELVKGILVSGVLVDAATGAPPAGRKWVGANKGKERLRGVAPNEEGHWSMYLYPGEFEITYSVEGMARPGVAQTLTVEAGKTYEGIRIEADLSKNE